MNTIERIENQKKLIEELGRYFDKEGYQPITGRILAMLIIMDKEQFSFDEIVEELQISKSSASNALKMLEIKGKIEYTTLPGDRKRYFRASVFNLEQILSHLDQKIKDVNITLNKAIELKADPNSRNSNYIKEFIKISTFFNSKLKNILEEYKNQ